MGQQPKSQIASAKCDASQCNINAVGRGAAHDARDHAQLAHRAATSAGAPLARAALNCSSFAFSREEGDALRQAWLVEGAQIPLEVDDAPYRDIGTPLLSYLRELTDDENTEVIVVMPELVVRGASRVLHNQRALYFKRLLLFEPRVILVSVPYQLIR